MDTVRILLVCASLFTVACVHAEPCVASTSASPAGACGDRADRYAVLRVLREELEPAAQFCAAEFCAAGHSAEVQVGFLLRADGTTQHPRMLLKSAPAVPAHVEECILDVVGQLRFPPFDRPEHIPISFPIRLR